MKNLQQTINHKKHFNKINNKLIGRQKYREIKEVTDKFVEGIKAPDVDALKKQNIAKDFYNYLVNVGALNPRTETLKLVNFDEKNPAYEFLYENLVEGQRKKIKLMQETT